MNSWARAVVIAAFAYVASAIFFTPWLGNFPMQVLIPLIVLLSALGFTGAVLQKTNLGIIPTLLALFLAAPIRIGPHLYYACFGAVNVPLTMFARDTRGTTTHFGVNLVPVVLLAALLYCLLGMNAPAPQRDVAGTTAG